MPHACQKKQEHLKARLLPREDSYKQQHNMESW